MGKRKLRVVQAVRSCGQCTVCCTELEIKEGLDIDGPIGTSCRELSSRGCGVYSKRPGICKSWECLWLAGWGTEDDRPDRRGALVYIARSGLCVREFGAVNADWFRSTFRYFPSIRFVEDDGRVRVLTVQDDGTVSEEVGPRYSQRSLQLAAQSMASALTFHYAKLLGGEWGVYTKQLPGEPSYSAAASSILKAALDRWLSCL